MPQIISNQDAENLRLYSGIGVAGVGLGAAVAMYSNNAPKPAPKAKKPRGPQPVPFDPTTHTGVVLGIDNSFDSDMYDLAKKTGDSREVRTYQSQAKARWENLSPKQQGDYDKIIREPMEGHLKKTGPKWKRNVRKAIRRL